MRATSKTVAIRLGQESRVDTLYQSLPRAPRCDAAYSYLDRQAAEGVYVDAIPVVDVDASNAFEAHSQYIKNLIQLRPPPALARRQFVVLLAHLRRIASLSQTSTKSGREAPQGEGPPGAPEAPAAIPQAFVPGVLPGERCLPGFLPGDYVGNYVTPDLPEGGPPQIVREEKAVDAAAPVQRARRKRHKKKRAQTNSS